MAKRINWGLIGIPDHEGVINVGGRVGASAGPDAFRRAFSRFTGDRAIHDALTVDIDVGSHGRDIEATHRDLARALEEAHREASITVVVGGGNDHAYAQLLGVRNALGPKSRLGCINVDAHLDVRPAEPKITSGSPFRLALDSGTLDPRRFVEFGIQSHCNGPDLWAYVRERKVKVVGLSELRGGRAPKVFQSTLRWLSSRCDAVVICLDLDAVSEAHAPGVSAPQAEGLTPGELIEMLEVAGADKKVASLGIYELNPAHDPGGGTARLAATSAWHFIERALRRKPR